MKIAGARSLWAELRPNELKAVRARFFKNVKKTKTCWLWQGSKDKRGYGRFGLRHYPFLAHRAAWELRKKQRVPRGKHVLHRCDVENCVRFAHFFLGTHDDNMRDMAKKGRAAATSLPEEKNPAAKLKRRDVQKMRALRRQGWLLKELAARFSVSVGHVGHITQRDNWRNVA